MLSEGRRGIDNMFTLRSGTLTMFLDKETYERAGLVGNPHGVKGKRGLKPRWSKWLGARALECPAHHLSCRDRPHSTVNGSRQEGV